MDFKIMLQTQDPEAFKRCAAVIHESVSAIEHMIDKPPLIKFTPCYSTIISSIGTGMTCALAKIFNVEITEGIAKEHFRSALQAIEKEAFIKNIGIPCVEEVGWRVAADFFNQQFEV